MRLRVAIPVAAAILLGGFWAIDALLVGACSDCGGQPHFPIVTLAEARDGTLVVQSVTPGLRYQDVALSHGERLEPYALDGAWTAESGGWPLHPRTEIHAGDVLRVPPAWDDAPLRVVHNETGLVMYALRPGASR